MRPLVPSLVLLAFLAAAPSSAQEPAAAAGRLAPAPPPPAAVIEKLGQGDRLFLAGEYRNALFAYQDAVYAAPRHAPARVKLGRAYLALRYPAQAVAQAEAALLEEPDGEDARALLEDARAAVARAQAVAAGAQPAAAVTSPAAAPAAAPRSGARVFKLTPDSGASRAAASEGSAGAVTSQSAAQHYRTALGLLQEREWERAAGELSRAIAADPKLSVAYSARGSAHFGLARYREAADDYRSALRLDGSLATPVYGLAECLRMLGDGKEAAALYEQYARSDAADVREELRSAAARRAQELR